MRLIKWFFITVILLIIALFVGGYVFLRTFDLNTYKPMIEKIASEQLGRKLELRGDAYFGISFVPTIIINDISLTNPSWAQNKDMVKADSIKIQVSILPLIKKQVVINEIRLVKPEIYVEVAKDGKASWDFDFPKSEENAEPVKAASGGWLIKSAHAAELPSEAAETDIRQILNDIVIREVAIENGYVVYFDHKSEPMTISIKDFKFSMEGMASPIKVAWSIIFNGMDCDGDGNFGSINALYDSKAYPYPAEVNVKALGLTASVNAKVTDVLGSKLKADFEVTASNPKGNLGAPAVTLNAAGNATMKTVFVNITKLDVAKNIITGTINADISGALPYAKADLMSDSINIETLMPEQKTSYKLPSLISTAHASEFVPDEEIPYDLLKIANADVKVMIKKLIVNKDISADNVSLTAAVKNGVLTLNPLTLNFGNGQIKVTSVINAAKQSLALKVLSDGILLQDISKSLIPANSDAFGIISGGKTHVDIDVAGSGKTARQLVNNLSGPLVVIVDSSVLQSGNLKYATNSLLTQILNLVKVDTSKQKQFELKCAVVRSDITNGVMNFPRGIAVDSSKLTAVADGTVNLRNDKLNINLNAYGTNVADISVTQALTNLIKISGTLKSPSVGIDTSGAVKTAASAVLGGPVAVGANMLLDRDPAPCYTALQGTTFSEHFEKPTGVVSATQGVYQGATDAVSNSVSAVKDTITGGVGAIVNSVTTNGNTKATAKEAAKEIESSVRDARDALKNLLKK